MFNIPITNHILTVKTTYRLDTQLHQCVYNYPYACIYYTRNSAVANKPRRICAKKQRHGWPPAPQHWTTA